MAFDKRPRAEIFLYIPINMKSTYWSSARNEKPTSVTYMPVISPMFRLNHDLYSARSYTEFQPTKSKPAS